MGLFNMTLLRDCNLLCLSLRGITIRYYDDSGQDHHFATLVKADAKSWFGAIGDYLGKESERSRSKLQTWEGHVEGLELGTSRTRL